MNNATNVPPRSRLLLTIGSIGPLGHLPASGTVAVAVAGIPLSWLMRHYLPPTSYWIIVVAYTALAVWLHDIGDRMLGEKDSRKLVLDELVGWFIAAAVMPFTWQTITIAFLLERAIDIAKIPPARWIERRVPGGLGVVGDDVIAGLYTLVIMAAATNWSLIRPLLGLE